MTIEGKQLADGQLAGSETDMYTVPASTRAFIRSIICANTGAGTNTVLLFLRPSGGTSRRLIKIPLEIDEQLYFNEPMTLDAGDKVRGQATSASEVDYVISGAEEAV
jgi:hypothetical protein